MRKNILVTATGGRSVGSGILHALTRSSPEVNARWNVIAADADSFAWGLYKVPQSVLMPLANDPQYPAALRKIIEQYHIDAVIPGSEPEVSLLAPGISGIDIPVITNHHTLIPLMTDKFIAHEKLKALGYDVIETCAFTEWQSAVKKWGFPLILKPTQNSGGSKGLQLIKTIEELETLDKLNRVPAGYCLQPYSGDMDEEFTVGVLSDKSGKLMGSIVMKRKLTGLSLLHSETINGKKYGISTGYSQGYIIKDEMVSSFCEELSLKLNSRGPLNIQLRKSGNKLLVFEIHPRFSGTTPIRADVGFNEPDLLLRNFLFGETFDEINYQYNVAAIRAFEHVIVPMDKML